VNADHVHVEFTCRSQPRSIGAPRRMADGWLAACRGTPRSSSRVRRADEYTTRTAAQLAAPLPRFATPAPRPLDRAHRRGSSRGCWPAAMVVAFVTVTRGARREGRGNSRDLLVPFFEEHSRVERYSTHGHICSHAFVGWIPYGHGEP
jgi:hypothetical protein